MGGWFGLEYKVIFISNPFTFTVKADLRLYWMGYLQYISHCACTAFCGWLWYGWWWVVCVVKIVV